MLDIRYIAGIIDGEAYVGICPNTSRYRSFVGKIMVSMATPKIVRLLQKQFGGSLRTYPRPGRNQRDAHTWMISGRKAVQFANWYKHYCILKRKQLLNILKLYDIKDRAPARNHPTEYQLELQKRLWLKTKLLNRRGK